MAEINRLSTIDSATGGDLLVIYDSSNSDARKVSLGSLVTYIDSVSAKKSEYTHQYEAPATATTVNITDGSANIWLTLTPTSTIATLILKLPSSGNCKDYQEILVNSTQQVTTLTIDGNGSTVAGAPTSISQNNYFKLKYDAIMKTWYRVG